MFRENELPVTLGPFTLHSLLGKGGMAVVYGAEVDLERFDYSLVVAHHEAPRGTSRLNRDQHREQRQQRWAKRPVAELVEICEKYSLPYPRDGKAAVKIMMPQLEHRDRFEAEWQSLMALNHPNVISVYGGGFDEEHGVHWYAMEVLERMLPGRQVSALTVREKLELIRQAAQGLSCLHSRGLVHRDIKPSNIITVREADGSLRARVTDLGIAKDTRRTVELTATAAVMGSPNFMAPEQAAGARGAGPAADIYSLGATLYTLIAGEAPYHGLNLFEVMGRLANERPPEPIAELTGGQMPASLVRLIESMMALRPGARPGSLDLVVSTLDHLLADRGAWLEHAGPARASEARPTVPPPSTRNDAQIAELLEGLGPTWIERPPEPIAKAAQPTAPPPSGTGGLIGIIAALLVLALAGVLLGPRLLDGGGAAASSSSEPTASIPSDGSAGSSSPRVASSDSSSPASAGNPLLEKARDVFRRELNLTLTRATAAANQGKGVEAQRMLEALEPRAAKLGLGAAMAESVRILREARYTALASRIQLLRGNLAERIRADRAGLDAAVAALEPEARALDRVGPWERLKLALQAAERDHAREQIGRALADGQLAIKRDQPQRAIALLDAVAEQATAHQLDAELRAARAQLATWRKARFTERLAEATRAGVAAAAADACAGALRPLEALAGEARAVEAEPALETARGEVLAARKTRLEARLATAIAAAGELARAGNRDEALAQLRPLGAEARAVGADDALRRAIAAVDAKGAEGFRLRLASAEQRAMTLIDADRFADAERALAELEQAAREAKAGEAWQAARSRLAEARVKRLGWHANRVSKLTGSDPAQARRALADLRKLAPQDPRLPDLQAALEAAERAARDRIATRAKLDALQTSAAKPSLATLQAIAKLRASAEAAGLAAAWSALEAKARGALVLEASGLAASLSEASADDGRGGQPLLDRLPALRARLQVSRQMAGADGQATLDRQLAALAREARRVEIALESGLADGTYEYREDGLRIVLQISKQHFGWAFHERIFGAKGVFKRVGVIVPGAGDRVSFFTYAPRKMRSNPTLVRKGAQLTLTTEAGRRMVFARKRTSVEPGDFRWEVRNNRLRELE